MDSDSGGSPAAGGLTEEMLTVIRENTIAVMTENSEQRGEWQEMLQRLLQKARDDQQPADSDFLQAVYELTEGKNPELSIDNPHQDAFLDILTGIAGGGRLAPEPAARPAPGAEEGAPLGAETDVSADVMNTIRNNTIAVMTVVPEKRDEWRKTIAGIQAQAQANDLHEDNAFFTALLDLLDGKQAALPESSPYKAFLDGILEGIAAVGNAEDGAATQTPPGSGLTANLIRTIHDNTVAVMTRLPEKRDEWRAAVARVLSQAETGNLSMDIDFFQAVLGILDGEEPHLPDSNPHSAVLKSIQQNIAGGETPEGDEETEAMLAVVRAFLSTNNWEETRQVLEQNQEVLLRPEVEELFEANIRHAREQGQNQAADMMQIHLVLLRDAKNLGIPTAFERMEELMRQATEEVETRAGAEEGEDLGPVPAAPGLPESFVRDVVAALRGSATRKQQLFEALSHLHPEEKGAEALIREVQKALFGDPVDRLGGSLEAPYDALWQAIARGVKGMD